MGTAQESTTENVDLDSASDSFLKVEISDALSEKDKVKFTVHTKTNLADYLKNDFAVTRLHEDFVWLHDDIRDNPAYAGHIIPPAPPKPDFDASQAKKNVTN